MNDDDAFSDDVSLLDYDHDWISSFYSCWILKVHPVFWKLYSMNKRERELNRWSR